MIRSILFGLKFLFFMLIIIFFSGLIGITIHELGHLFAATLSGCNYAQIIYSPGQMPNTSMQCREGTNIFFITLAGFILTTALSLVLFFCSTHIIRYVAAFVFAIGSLAAAYDFYWLGIKKIPVIAINFLSFVLMSLVVMKIALLYFESSKKI